MGKLREFVTRCKAALAGEYAIRTWWGCDGLKGEEFRRWFLDRLMAKINATLPTGIHYEKGQPIENRNWRRLDDNYQRHLYQDAQAVRDKLQRRIIVRQFQTDIVRARLSHLLTTDD